MQYTTRLFGPLEGLHDLYISLVRGLVSMRRVLEFMQLPTLQEIHKGHKPFVYQHTIELQDVHFRFGDQPVLQGVNLKLVKGKSYALVGMSGSGKTTLANLLCGLYQPDQGRILIDGVPLEEISLRELRVHIGLVSQQVHLFNDTIWDNIHYGNFKCEPSGVEKMIKQVGLNGLDRQAEIGEQGVQLSGGQKQRIALARPLLQPVELLILDEATAALDAESEEDLFQRIQHLYGDQTILLISHRLSAVPLDLFLACWDTRAISGGNQPCFDWTWLDMPDEPPRVRPHHVAAILQRNLVSMSATNSQADCVQGVAGIEQLAEDVGTWAECEKQALKARLNQCTELFLDVALSREGHGAFLHYASRICGLDDLSVLGREFESISQGWFVAKNLCFKGVIKETPKLIPRI